MKKLPIADNYLLHLEPDGQNLRVVLADTFQELACHKVKAKQLKDFIDADDASLFKGRLRLKNKHGMVTVYFKGTGMGTIDAHQLLV